MSKRWSKEEKKELMRWLENGWDYVFPGYGQAALHINDSFGNNRTANACRLMDAKMCKAERILSNQPDAAQNREG